MRSARSGSVAASAFATSPSADALEVSRQTLTYTAVLIRRHRAQIGSC
jgi:hypothetical protein